MPTYDYVCTVCKSQFEIFQKMSDLHLTICPECGGEIIRKIGAGAGMIFKGTGFYETDYKSKTKNEKKTVSKPNGKEKPITKTSSVTD